MAEVRFFNEGTALEVQPGENLRLAALRAGVQLYRGWHVPLNCKGQGKCGSCRVEVSDPDAVAPLERSPAEHRFLDRRFSDPATRLACQVSVQADLAVRTQPRRTRKVDTRNLLPRTF